MDDATAALRAEIAALRAELAVLKSRIDGQMLGLIDGIHEDVDDDREVMDKVVIPAILLIAGDGHRRLLREWLAATAVSLHDPDRDRPSRAELRVAYWRQVLDEKPEWFGFDPSGWVLPDAD